MKRLLKILTGRFFAFVVLISFQIFILVTLILNVLERSNLYFTIIYILGFIAAFYVVSREEHPAFKISWVIVILAAPVFGVPFYLIFGNKRDTKKIGRQLSEYNKYFLYNSKNVFPPPEISTIEALNEKNRNYKRQSEYLANLTHSSLYDGTSIKYYESGELAIEDILASIESASRFILIEIFIIDFGYLWDKLLTLLQKKVEENVSVYLLYDDLGTIQNFPIHYERTLNKMGIKATVFNKLKAHLNPRLNYRDHRKLIIIDGYTGYTGGINIADEYINRKIRFGHWKDTAVKLEGKAVFSMTEMFFQQWCFASKTPIDISQFTVRKSSESDGWVQPFGDSPLDNDNIAENAYIQIINHASNYVWITTPYLILDTQMITALSIAAQSGVDVRIITPGIPDKWYVHSVSRSHYAQLLRAGVRIYEYTPGFIHSKMFVCDDSVAIVGTTNMDYRSFYLHFECGVAMYYNSAINDVRNDIDRTYDLSKEILLSEEMKTPLLTRILRNILKLFSPMM
jgi:cardiolipin synthase